jgi:hypothetical protein
MAAGGWKKAKDVTMPAAFGENAVGQGFMQVIRRFTPCAAGIRRGSSYTEPRRNGRAAAALNSVPTNRA